MKLITHSILIICIACLLPVQNSMASGNPYTALDGATQRISRVNLPQLSLQNPFKATAYLGAAARIEQIKRLLATGKAKEAQEVLKELNVRLAILETGKPVRNDGSMRNLLNLTVDSEAQVVVEYPATNIGYVSIYWGSFPLVSVGCMEFTNSKDAQNIRELVSPKGFRDLRISETFENLPANSTERIYALNPSNYCKYTPETEIALVSKEESDVTLLEPDSLDFLQPKAVVVLKGTPETIKTKVETWAKANQIAILSLEEARQRETYLVTGNLWVKENLDWLKYFSVYKGEVRHSGFQMFVQNGKRLYQVISPSKKVGMEGMRLVLAKNPIHLLDANRIRKLLLEDLSPQTVPMLPKSGKNAYIGDLHMHTFYSDGLPSPEGLMLEAMYCYMDFAAITDHNTLDGALRADRQLRKNGFAFPLMIGEEVTTLWSHFGAYPLKSLISPKLGIYEITREAHKQGAVVQWNHPAYPNYLWAQKSYSLPLKENGLDAWEHIPYDYEERLQNGTIPILTNGTDTHTGTFDYLDRTQIFAPSPKGDDLAESIRRGQVVLVNASSNQGKHLIYGPNTPCNYAWSLLAEGSWLKATKKEQIRRTLQHADIAALLRESAPVTSIGNKN